MAALPNARHERFAQELAKGASQQQAYVLAGFKAHASNPSVLAKDKRILARLAEIHSERVEIERKATEKAAEALSIDKQWVLARLQRNAETALGERLVKGPVLTKESGKAAIREVEYMDRDPAAANRSLELIGKELGMFVDRKEVRVGALDHLNADERDQLRDAVRSELERRAGRTGSPGPAGQAGALSTLQ